ncbi:MAG: hypothetical protein KatS3mg124_0173 [Porticoccaceae bacterium]|nr:MAG: hypothetical protein KatS3mg124_0173 [Porticoccaceae bacterium]
MRRICEQLIDAFPSPRRCEFVREFAIPFPTYVFLDLMDLPRERAADFLAWEETLMRGADFAARAAAARAIYTYLESHLDRQRRAPSNALNRAIVEATFRDRPLTHLERMGMYFVLYVGGLDTVYSTLGWAMREIARDPTLQERLRAHPEEISDAVEEFLRAFSVVVTHRQVRRDLHFHGVELRAGDEIHLPLALAGRDPEVFPDPHRIDPGRRPRHLAFGTGVHTCLGRHLARRELRIVLETFLERFPVIRLAPGETYRFHTGRTFGIDSLPLVLG